jgi:hypothetical protein
MRRIVVIVALGVLAASAQVGGASASRSVQFGIQDDAWLADGPGTLDHRLDILQKLGVSIVRYSIHWDQVAPTRPTRALASTDPAYHWTAADAVLQGLRERGIEPLVTLYGSPAWANGGRKANAPPKSWRTFADFAYAAAKRYPFVRKWTIWNEPNQNLYLAGTSPSLYVKTLLNPGTTRSIARTGARASQEVSLHRAGTAAATAARLGARAREGARKARRVRAQPVPHAAARDAAARRVRLLRRDLDGEPRPPVEGGARDFGRKPIWLTEYGYQTNPPDGLGVAPALQAAYVGEAALRAYQAPA